MLLRTLTLLTALFVSTSSFADEIYKWVTPDGVTHYSSKKADERASLAKLPPINRGDYKIASISGATCDKHGGVNCQAGQDVDGSVICFDGFDGASARFSFHCSSPKLRISDISDPDAIGRVSVFVRNDKSVLADAPTVTFTTGEGAKLNLKGPKEIPPFQMAEFTMISGAIAKSGQKPSSSQFNVTCKNCD